MNEKTYTEAELKENTLKYFNNDELATDVWMKKYALQDNEGNYLELTPDDTHRRLAREFARIESKYPNALSEEEIYQLFKNFKYIVPQGSPMEGIGNDYRIQSLSNCFVIDSPEDSYGGILKTDQELVQLMKRRGGVGFDISYIRPKGTRTTNAAKTTDGIAIFMERFSNSTREVAQNGRRGALLQSISVLHPEIETFIDVKKDLKKVTGANISIRLTDSFMNAVKNNEKFMLKWPIDSEKPIITKEIEARKLWNKIIEAAWSSAEPGILFWDTAIKYTPSDIYKDFGFESKSTNPCVVGNTLILTTQGWIKIKNLKKYENIGIITQDKLGNKTISKLEWSGITKKQDNIYKIIFEDKTYCKVNDKHKFYDENYNEIIAIESKNKNVISYKKTLKIIEIKKLKKKENVYDLTANPNYNFFMKYSKNESFFTTNKIDENCVLSVDCGEIILSPADSCRLITINLTNYVKDKFLENAIFNYDLFSKHIIIAQKLLDDLIDLELEQVDKIINKIKKDPESDETKRIELNLWNKIKKSAINGRRTGLGIIGLGDTVAMLGIKYGSDESINVIEKIYKTLAINSEKSSVIMAKERGTFPVFNFDLEKGHPFLERIWNEDKELYELYKKYGRRNIATTTTAPGGSMSILTQTSSGIEPVFMLEYKRRKKIMGEDNTIKSNFTDQNGDKWQEFIVYHKGLQDWMNITNETDVTKSPYWGATANEINHIKSVDIQAVAQKWVSHSISKTVNLPKDVSKELVSDLYMRAWEKGCKGFTIYREGSRSGVLIANEKEDDNIKINNAPKRPKELLADYYVTTANGIKFAVIVGLWKDTNKPYEIFAFENPPMDKNVKGRIVKVKKGHYKFINGEFEIDNIQLAAERVEQRAHTIFMSMLLRHGVQIPYILNVVKKVDDNITSFSSACRRVLSKYVDTEILNEKCPECGGQLVREESCVHCRECTYSRC